MLVPDVDAEADRARGRAGAATRCRAGAEPDRLYLRSHFFFTGFTVDHDFLYNTRGKPAFVAATVHHREFDRVGLGAREGVKDARLFFAFFRDLFAIFLIAEVPFVDRGEDGLAFFDELCSSASFFSSFAIVLSPLTIRLSSSRPTCVLRHSALFFRPCSLYSYRPSWLFRQRPLLGCFLAWQPAVLPFLSIPFLPPAERTFCFFCLPSFFPQFRFSFCEVFFFFFKRLYFAAQLCNLAPRIVISSASSVTSSPNVLISSPRSDFLGLGPQHFFREPGFFFSLGGDPAARRPKLCPTRLRRGRRRLPHSPGSGRLCAVRNRLPASSRRCSLPVRNPMLLNAQWM